MRSREEIEKEMRKVNAELATIVYYVNGSISERPRKYTRKDGSESEQKALPTLQYYAGGRQGGKRVPRKLLPAMRQRVANGRRRKELLRKLDELAAELTLLWELLAAALAAPNRIEDIDKNILAAAVGFGRKVCERCLNAAARRGARGRSGFRKKTVRSVLGPLDVRRPYFAPNLKAIRASLRGRRGSPKRHLPRTARNARCARRGGARCACPFDARADFVDGMTRSLSWLVQRAGVVCGSFEEGATLLGEFTAATMSESTFRLKVLAAGRRAEADQRMKGRKLGLVPEYSSAQIASSVPCLPTLYCLMDGIGVP